MTLRRLVCVFSLCTWMALSGFCENICPQVAELNSVHEISVVVNTTIIEKSFTWRKPSNDTQALACKIAKRLCITIENHPYNGTMDNVTYASHLVITNVTKGDSGLWRLKDGTSTAVVDVCYLVTARKPRCSINSDSDWDDLDLGDNITLTVNIMSYYCSLNASFALTTGDVTQMVLQNHIVDNRTDRDAYDVVLSTTFDVSLARFGNVTLEFSCTNTTWTPTCDGIPKLVKSKPQCTIASNRDTEHLDLDDEITLTVDIEGYFCPGLDAFTLTTGDVTDVLLRNHAVDNVTDAIRNNTFTTTPTRFGHVNVDYTCDGDTRRLDCEGVKELIGIKTTSTWPLSSTTSLETFTAMATESTTTSNPGLPIPIIVGASVALLLLILLVVVIVVTRRQLVHTAQRYVVQRKKRPSAPTEQEG